MTKQTPKEYAIELFKKFDIRRILDHDEDAFRLTKEFADACLDELIANCDYSTEFYEKTKIELEKYIPPKSF